MPCGPVAIETSVWELVLVEGSVNEPCVQEVSGNDITAGGGGECSTWASLAERLLPPTPTDICHGDSRAL